MPSKEPPVVIPPSTPETAVFPANEEYDYFETKFYDPQPMGDQISIQEIKNVVSEFNAEYLKYKVIKAEHKRKCNTFGYFAVCIFFYDVYLLFQFTKPSFLGIFTNGEVILLTGFLMVFLNKVCGCLFGCKLVGDPLFELKDKCQDIIDKHNEILRDKKLKWHLPDEFPSWIELTKDMEKKNTHLEIPNQLPIPRNSHNLIAFPHHRYKSDDHHYETWRYTPDSFVAHLADGRISCKEVQDFLCEMNDHLRNPYKVSRRMAWTVNLLVNIEIFGLFYIHNHYPERLSIWLQIPIAFFAILIASLLTGDEFQKEDAKKLRHMKEGSQRILKKHNRILKNRGIQWNLPKDFPQWIELCKDRRNQDAPSQHIEVPRENQRVQITLEGDVEAGKAGNQNKRSENDLSVPLLGDDNQHL